MFGGGLCSYLCKSCTCTTPSGWKYTNLPRAANAGQSAICWVRREQRPLLYRGFCISEVCRFHIPDGRMVPKAPHPWTCLFASSSLHTVMLPLTFPHPRWYPEWLEIPKGQPGTGENTGECMTHNNNPNIHGCWRGREQAGKSLSHTGWARRHGRDLKANGIRTCRGETQAFFLYNASLIIPCLNNDILILPCLRNCRVNGGRDWGNETSSRFINKHSVPEHWAERSLLA